MGAISSVIVSNLVAAESSAIQFRAIKLAAMLGVGSFIISCIKSNINTDTICKSLCTSLQITQNPRDIMEFATRLFSGDTSKKNLDAVINTAQRLGGHTHDLSERQKIEGRYIAGKATVILRFLALVGEDAASALLGYAVLHGLGLNYYAKELGASFTQTLFATTLTAGLEAASEQLSFRMTK